MRPPPAGRGWPSRSRANASQRFHCDVPAEAKWRSVRWGPAPKAWEDLIPPRSLVVGLEARPHLLRELLQPRGVDEQQGDARDLVDGGLDALDGWIRRTEDVLHLARTVAERILGHRLQLGHDRRPVQLWARRGSGWRGGSDSRRDVGHRRDAWGCRRLARLHG